MKPPKGPPGEQPPVVLWTLARYVLGLSGSCRSNASRRQGPSPDLARPWRPRRVGLTVGVRAASRGLRTCSSCSLLLAARSLTGISEPKTLPLLPVRPSALSSPSSSSSVAHLHPFPSSLRGGRLHRLPALSFFETSPSPWWSVLPPVSMIAAVSRPPHALAGPPQPPTALPASGLAPARIHSDGRNHADTAIAVAVRRVSCGTPSGFHIRPPSTSCWPFGVFGFSSPWKLRDWFVDIYKITCWHFE